MPSNPDPSAANPPPLQAVIFDIGNVILHFDFGLALQKTAELSEIHDTAQLLAHIDQIKVAYEDGQIDRPAFLRAVFDALKFRGSEAQFISAWEEIFTPNEPMLALIEQLRHRLPLYLLSNTSDIHRDYIFREYPVFQHFKAGVYSYEARASKPYPEIYQIAQTQLGVNPATTFFIDDLLPNIEAARKLGFVTHHYHADRHDELLAALRARGLP